MSWKNKPLIEELAEAVHNAWWEEKKRQGKSEGHPDAVPYSQLPENVKEYDRVTVRTVLGKLGEIFREV